MRGIILLILLSLLALGSPVHAQEATKAIKYQYDHQVDNQRILIETPVFGISKFYMQSLTPKDLTNVDPKSLENTQVLKIQAKDIELKPLEGCPACTLKMKLDRPLTEIHYIDSEGQQTRILDYEVRNNILAMPMDRLGIYGFTYQSDEEIAKSLLQSNNYLDAKSFSPFSKGIAIGLVLLSLYLFKSKHKALSL